MKKLFVLLFVALFTLIGVSCGDDASTAPTYNLRGRGPAGGWVFYDKGSYSDGWRYMEAWTDDESGGYRWKNDQTETTGTSTDIGTGYHNTYNCMTESEHPAAEAARDATYGDKNDWFLPSKDELYKMYVNLWRGTNDDEGNATYTQVGNFDDSENYWSSSERIAQTEHAWVQNFNVHGGNQTASYKDNSNKFVRVVRRF